MQATSFELLRSTEIESQFWHERNKKLIFVILALILNTISKCHSKYGLKKKRETKEKTCPA